MSLIVEDGTGLANAESYVSVEDCVTYASNRGLTFPGTDLPGSEAALRRATAAIDSRYRSRFVGFRTQRHAQALEWPRTGAYYYTPQNSRLPYATFGGYGGDAFYNLVQFDIIASDLVPPEIINATCEAAIRELASPGALAPDLKRGGMIRSLKAGSVGIDYQNGAPAMTIYTAIDQALSALLAPSAPFSAAAVRG